MLEFKWDLLISQLVTFLVAMTVVWKLSWKPLMKFIKDRQDTIRNSLENAEKMRIAASQLEEDYKLRLQKVEKQTKDLIALSKLEGNKAKEEIVANAQKEIADMHKRAQEHLEIEREQIMKELRSHIINLSMDLTSKVIEDSSLQGISERRFQEILTQLEDSKEPASAC
jgi:F-type H+-transporting ATPase subunit b